MVTVSDSGVGGGAPDLAGHRARLQRFFESRRCSAPLAQDLTQEVFLRAVAYQRVRPIENAQSFLLQVAANLLRDVSRSAARWRAAPLDELSDVSLADPITPERIVEGREEICAVSAALSELDARTQRIFLLNRIEQLRHKEIATHLGLSVSLIEKSVRTAHRHLEARGAAR